MAVPARWIPPTVLGGAWQMAIDGWLLEQGEAVLRLYRWNRPTLSLGFHQRHWPEHWGPLHQQGAIDLVRRPSGGRAVLHGGDLTYALVWPNPPQGRLEAYQAACRWLQHAFATMGQPLSLGREPVRGQRDANCFATGTAADLVHRNGGKRIGSAQVWRRGVLLQHGSIQLAPPAKLWQQVFGQDPPRLASLPLQGPELEALLRSSAEAHLGPMASLHSRDLQPEELAAIASRLEDQRPAAVSSVTSPEAIIERTTRSRPMPNG
ncbi:MAG: lipoate--protein ligase family protein [Cyanobacteriota bacterium]|nr:lipoate--protein ligase family protein [Cyanobacteriota bacterium]